MNSFEFKLKTILPTALIGGLVGGVGLITINLMPIKGWWIIAVYVLIMHAVMLALKFNKKIEVTFLKAFLTGVLTFMLMTYILYFYIITFDNPGSGITLYGHAWRFLLMFGIALVSSAILGLFFLKTKQEARTS